MMVATSPAFEAACQAILGQFFTAYPDAAMQARANKLLRLLRASENQWTGKIEGWAAGIIYAVTTDGRSPCGVPGLLNAEFEELMHVSMGTARGRAARIRELVTW